MLNKAGKGAVLALSFITTGLTAAHGVLRIDYSMLRDEKQAVLTPHHGVIPVNPGDVKVDAEAMKYNKKTFGFKLQDVTDTTVEEGVQLLIKALENKMEGVTQLRILVYGAQFAYRLLDTYIKEPLQEKYPNMQIVYVDVMSINTEPGERYLPLGKAWEKAYTLPTPYSDADRTNAQKTLELYNYYSTEVL